MAEKRMITKKVTDSDDFCSLSSSAQALYMHLNLNADDDGFNNQVRLAMFKAHASDDDLNVLLAKKFIIQFERGIIVIKHWRMANALRKDRYTPTVFKKEKALLRLKENGAYTIDLNDAEATRLPDGCQVVATDKNRIDKSRLLKDSGDKSTRFVAPSPDEVNAYCVSKGYKVDANRFCDFYESKGWLVGKNKMKDWKAAVRTWNNRGDFKNQQSSKNNHLTMQREYDFDALEKELTGGYDGTE